MKFKDSDILGRWCGEGVTTVGSMSEIDRDLETIRAIMGEVNPEVSVGMAVRELMSATQSLSELAASKTNEPLVRLDVNDIEIAYTRLGRMLSRLR